MLDWWRSKGKCSNCSRMGYVGEGSVMAPGHYINSGQWEIYLVGAVQYQDTFQPQTTPYETSYCWVLRPEGLPFGSCDFRPTSMKWSRLRDVPV